MDGVTAMIRRLLLLALACSASAEAQLALSPQPVLKIGTDASPDYQFNRIEHLRRLSDGRIVVTTGPDIRFYDAAGKYLSKAGGRGRGPGEFQYISSLIVMPGDSLMTMNINSIVVLGPTGKFVRQSQPDLKPLSSGDWFTEGIELLPNGNLLAPQYSRKESNTPSPTLFRPPVRYSILDLPTAKVTPLHGGGGIAQQFVNGQPIVMPFSPHEQQAVGADRVYVGDNDSTTIHAFTLDGTPAGTFAVADRPIPVTAAELAAYKERQREWATTNRMSKEDFEQRWSAGPKPTRHPYWGTALVDAAGVLWVSGPPRGSQAPIVWTAFERNGRRIGTVTMPARFTPKDIGRDYVLGVQRDEDDVESIAMYSLRRR
jgi:hypothetical protein